MPVRLRVADALATGQRLRADPGGDDLRLTAFHQIGEGVEEFRAMRVRVTRTLRLSSGSASRRM
ncbi:hypothetical protein [Sphingomonas sp. ID0503]|uniref:hypothetical protein n=1 Tax=Sphingomonas sp. ID0503 TaxID=3399691 RepID=UPI003AFAE10D